MNSWFVTLIILVAVAVLLAVYPFVRFAIIRARLSKRIKKFCVERGYQLRCTCRHPWLSSNRADKYDIVIETDKKLYYIKLFGILHHRNVLAITGNRRYSIRKYIFFGGNKVGNTIMKSGETERTFPDYFSKREESKDKTVSNVILINPVPAKILTGAPGKEHNLYFGEEIDGTAIIPGKEIFAYIDYIDK